VSTLLSLYSKLNTNGSNPFKGKGKFGTVAVSTCRESSLFVAIKFIPKEIIFTTKSADRIKNVSQCDMFSSVRLNHNVMQKLS
jgi:transposase-like protein